MVKFANKVWIYFIEYPSTKANSTGYGTLYGDMAGGRCVGATNYKQQVYALARYINRNGEIIPENIITKAPSAELRPAKR